MKQMTDYQRELVTTNMSVVDHVVFYRSPK